jgi:hypothetical protein
MSNRGCPSFTVPGYEILREMRDEFLTLLSFSVVVPLLATLGINNKVSFLEKGGTGYVQSCHTDGDSNESFAV